MSWEKWCESPDIFFWKKDEPSPWRSPDFLLSPPDSSVPSCLLLFCSVFLHSPLFDTSRLCPSILQLNPVFFPSALSASPILLHHPLLDLSLTLCLIFFFFTFTSSFILSSWKAYAVLPPCLSTQTPPFSGLKSEFVDYARNHFHASWSQSEALTTEVGKKERHVTASLLLLMTYI